MQKVVTESDLNRPEARRLKFEIGRCGRATKTRCAFRCNRVAVLQVPRVRRMKYNPLGKVPCLILDDGEAVFDSRVICEYVDTLTPVGKLLPQERRERTEVRCWEALADGMLDAAEQIRLETAQREEGQRNAAWIARQQRKIDEGLKAMSKGLAAKTWCSANHFTLADIACGCALGYIEFQMPEVNWREEYPNLDKHVQRLSLRQSFIDTLPA
jgi:glutathione S-transferase